MIAETVNFNSSMLLDGAYDPDSKEMVLTFSNGRSYTFRGVDQKVWDGMKLAPSAGGYFNAEIKGKYAE